MRQEIGVDTVTGASHPFIARRQTGSVNGALWFMDNIEAFRAEHRELARLMDRYGEMLAGREPPAALPFLHFRREFGRSLKQHLKREDWLLYPRLQASSCPEVRNVAQRLCAEIGAFEAAFGLYERRWNSTQICEDWEGYRQESATMIRRLRSRIDAEERELYPLADRLAA